MVRLDVRTGDGCLVPPVPSDLEGLADGRDDVLHLTAFACAEHEVLEMVSPTIIVQRSFELIVDPSVGYLQDARLGDGRPRFVDAPYILISLVAHVSSKNDGLSGGVTIQQLRNGEGKLSGRIR